MSFIIYNKLIDPRNSSLTTEELIKELVIKDDFSEHIIIQSTGRLFRHYNNFATDLYFDSYKKSFRPPQITTLDKFIKSIFNGIEQFMDFRFISTNYKIALLDELQSEINLEYYSQNGRIKYSLLVKLVALIDGLKKDGFSYSDLYKDLVEESEELVEPRKLKDIALIYEALSKKMIENRLVDDVDALNLLTSFILENDAKLFDSKKILFLDNFNEFKNPEIQFFKAIRDKIPILINLDFSEDFGPTFNNIKDLIAELIESGFKVYDSDLISQKAENIDNISEPVYLKKFLFRESRWDNADIRGHRKESLNQKIKIIECFNKKDEVNTLIKLIKYLHSTGIELSDIRINSRNPSDYTDIIRNEFRRNGIPVNISDRFSLKSSIVSTTLFSFLNLISNGFKRNDLIQFLKSPLIKITRSNSEEWSYRDIYAVEELTAKKRIFGGFENGGISQWLNVDFNTNENEKLSSKLLVDLAKQLQKYDPINKSYTFSDYTKLIKEFLREFGVLLKVKVETNNIDRFESFHAKRETEMNSKALSTLIKLLNESEFILGKVRSSNNYSIQELNEIFFSLLIESKYQVRELYDFGVTFTSIEQSRGIPKRINILLGANDGIFPMRYSTDVLLGKELKGSLQKHIIAEKNLFYQFLTNGKKQDKDISDIYIFYSEKEDDKELVPSTFLASLVDLFSNENLDNKIIKSKDKTEKWLNVKTRKNINEHKQEIYQIIDDFISNINIEKTLQINEISEKSLKRFEKHVKSDFSASKLESYVKSPYDYFIERILLARESEEINEDLSNLEKGNILHDISKRFYAELQKKPEFVVQKHIIKSTNKKYDIIPVDIKKADKVYLFRLISDIAEQVLEERRYKHPFFEIFKDEILGTSGKKGIISNWLDIEIKKAEDINYEIYPCLFELPFENEDLIGENVLSENLRLRGTIDRVDICFNNDIYDFFIIDYKKSEASVSSNDALKNGTSFQMTLYLKAFELFANKHYNGVFRPAGAYFQTYDPDENGEYILQVINNKEYLFPEWFRTSRGASKTEQELNEFIDLSIEKAEYVLDKIKEGIFDHKAKSKIENRKDLIYRDKSNFL